MIPFWLFITIETFPFWIFALMLALTPIERHYRPEIYRDKL